MCLLDLSGKGLRLSSDHLGTDQIQIYIAQSSFVLFDWKSCLDGSLIQLKCQIASFMEGLYLCIAGKQAKGANLIELSWSETSDRISIASTSDSYHVSVHIPTVCDHAVFRPVSVTATNLIFQALGQGPLINRLLRDMVSSAQFSSLTVEYEPDLNLLSLSSSYPNGVATVRQCLGSLGIDLAKKDTYFRFRYSKKIGRPSMVLMYLMCSYNKNFLLLASKIIESCTSGSIRINDDGIFSLQLMAGLSLGNMYAEFIVLQQVRWEFHFNGFT
jgi:hypothetical protein